MRCVRRSSSPVTISTRCCSLSETRWNGRWVLLFLSEKAWLFDSLNLLLLTAVFCHTPSQSWLRRVLRDWSHSEPRRPWWWSHRPEGLNHLERWQIRKDEEIRKWITPTDWNKEVIWFYLQKIHCHPLLPAALLLSFFHSFSLFQFWKLNTTILNWLHVNF